MNAFKGVSDTFNHNVSLTPSTQILINFLDSKILKYNFQGKPLYYDFPNHFFQCAVAIGINLVKRQLKTFEAYRQRTICHSRKVFTNFSGTILMLYFLGLSFPKWYEYSVVRCSKGYSERMV